MAQYIYSNCLTLDVGCYLFSDSTYTTRAFDGKYSDGNNCYTVSGGQGLITNVEICGVYIDIYGPSYMNTAFNPYTFTAVSTDVVDTDVYVDIYWYGELGSVITSSIVIYNGTTNNSDINAYYFGPGENFSYANVYISPPNSTTQDYFVGQIFSL